MKHTVRFIVLFLILVIGSSNVWADITVDDIIINVLPNSSAGTVTVTNENIVANTDGTTTVTFTASPATGYSIDASHIIAEKMVNAMAPRREKGLSSSLPITANGGNSFSFTIPEGYTGAYVTVTFFKTTANGITSLSQITDLNGTYVLTADINAAGYTSKGDFKGTLDGGFHKIYNLSEPLFTSTSENAVIRNITFEAVGISIGGNAGAVTGSAAGNTRIYNCGILPSSVERDDAGNVSGFYGSSVGSSGGCCGGLVGFLDDNARVINCYSYATITNGTTVGGIVGYNNGTSSQSGITTMVMNCVFYGDITGGSTVSPVYGGNNIDNTFVDTDTPGGLATYNYYAYSQLRSNTIADANYHCTLGMEERFLVRDALYRQLLNSNKKLAAKYASTTSTTVNPNEMAKWVFETADRSIVNPYPYPVLKAQGYYPSIINIDIENAPDSAFVGRLNGGRLDKTLSVKIDGVGTNAPDGATLIDKEGNAVTSRTLKIARTDKDTTRFNFNYDKIQLPYYNDYGTKNYTKNKVVTGWIITEIDGGTPGTFTEADEWGGYNFADRRCTEKDKHRIFSQGAYYDVPYGVKSITIKPYWGKAAYVSDKYYDVVYKQVTTVIKNYAAYSSQDVTGLGTQHSFTTISGVEQAVDIDINGDPQTVYTTIDNARKSMSIPTSGKTVYDYAVVLVGNVHQATKLYSTSNNTTNDAPYTIMSIDLDKDNEPDYSFIFSHFNRQDVSSIRFDFLNMIGTAEAQKPNGADQLMNVSIFNPKGWFEVTNTCTTHITQFEADNKNKTASPVIFLGGIIDQYTSTKDINISSDTYNHRTSYIHLGSNACFREFGNGTHSDGWYFTNHVPVSVTGGDFEGFYLSGVYRPDAQVQADDAEGYISGGRFKEMAGAAQQMIEGNVHWQIYDADITNFYGGGINADKPITGSVTTDIINSHVGTFCGGPKFGDMQKAGTQITIKYAVSKDGKNPESRTDDIAEDGIVTTNATGCTFGTFFGAGYGGASSFKLKYYDETSPDFNTYISKYNGDRGKYFDGNNSSYKTDYGNKGPGVATEFDYEFFVWSSGAVGARFYVNYTTFSLAKTRNVNSTLTNCTVEKNFYGGGSLGVVDGTATSILDGCTVTGSVYGGGFSASIPIVPVRDINFKKTPSFNQQAGIFDMGEKYGTQDYKWTEGTLTVNQTALDGTNIKTDVSLDGLGQVKDTKLTVQGNCKIDGSVYGGGEESGVDGDTEVKVKGGTIGIEGNGGVEYGNVYGGGKGKRDNVTAGQVKGSTKVTIQNTTVDGTTTIPKIYHNVYGGGAYGSVGDFEYNATTGMPTGLKAGASENSGKTQVEITGGTFGWNGKENGMIFGSSRGDVGAPNGIEDQMAWVYDTEVKIGTLGSGSVFTTPTIKGSVYGGGENGHNFHNADVYIYSGTIGIPTGTPVTSGGEEYSGAAYSYRGNVYGGGCGTDKYYSNTEGVTNPYDGNGDKYNPKAGIVQGTATVNITGGHVVHNVYGAGAMGSVGTADVATSGKTTVTISGGRIGYDGNGNGNVFGAARGEYGTSTVLSKNLANVRETEVNINYTTTPAADNTEKTVQLIAGSVFGGGEAGTVKESVAVNMTGGLILKDIYGGGALADTQTSNWDASANSGAGYWATGKSSASATTTVRLMGGRVVEEVYGGGLGEDGKPAYVWGDVLVELNNNNSDSDVDATKPGCAVGQIFGCNNVNGTPKGDVMVHVYGTQNKDASKTTIGAKFALDKIDLDQGENESAADYLARLKTYLAGRIDLAEALSIETSTYQDTYDDSSDASAVKTAINGINSDINDKGSATINALRYDVKAVYGGGNQATYDPATAWNGTAGSKTQVIIEGCEETSIETVYGGGNAAAVPETNVDVRAAYEIGTVFGGGNGYSATDNHADPSAPNYNPGADVGTKDHGVSTANNYGTGNANTVLKGGLIHEAYGGSNQYGKIIGKVNINTNPEASTCDLDVEKLVGAGKNADVDGDLIMILGCKPSTKTPLVFAGADNADVNGNVELTITSGTFGQVFGGNNLGGHIKGHIKLNIEETGCTPIKIDELYLGGNQAAYSRYGYYLDASDNKVKPRTAAMSDPQAEGYKEAVAGRISVPYDEPELNVISCTSIGKVFGGGWGEGAVMYADPTVNINMIKGKPNGVESSSLGTIGDVYGGGNAAKVIGNTTVNIGTATKVQLHESLKPDGVTYNMSTEKDVLGANITGNVYGGGKLADVGDTELGTDNDGNTIDVINVASNTFVNIGASKGSEILENSQPTGRYNYTAVNLTGITIGGNVFGGGEGEAKESGEGAFRCGKAMVTGGTNIAIGNGTINGTIYGGGEVGRVEGNTIVTIGIGAGGTTPASAPEIKGDVFGAGKGEKTHGYSALVRGNPVVTIEGDAKVRGSVYGGGEIASVGKYNVKKGPNNPVGAPDDVLPGMPYSLANSGSGYCTVIIRGNAEIGPESEMKMKTTSGKPDDTGHVFGAGKGVLPYEGYGVTDDPWETDPWRVSINNEKDVFNSSSTYGANYEKEYFKFIETLALATETHVTIGGNAFVKGSVYGGSMNGHVQHDTHVAIEGGQIGQGEGVTKGRYTDTDWASGSLAECPHWDYDASSGAPYDPLAETDGSYKYDKYGFVPTTQREETSKGGLPEAKDGHTYYGNVFGGGSGVIPYAPGRWHRGAGSVGGDTYVNITGGHILTSVYGGNEHTDVGTYEKDTSGQPTTTPVANDARGKCTINMTGGTVGVPRTDSEKGLHPVVGNLYGAGKGDQRIFFNTWTNVISTEVNISGDAHIFGSVFGGGEDGHVISDAKTNIGDVTIKTGKDANGDEITENVTAKDGLIIGTTGTSYYDGNVFGGGRGFSGDAQTAGTVGGNIEVNIGKGAVYGSVYGGGRLASVGTLFEFPTLTNGDPNPAYGNFKEDETGTNAKTYGHVLVNISGGTIGNAAATGDGVKYSGNVFGGSMGRLELLNGTRNPIWPKMAQVKSATVNISGDATVIRRSVYGGGELGTVRDNTYVTIGGTLGTNKTTVTPSGSPTVRRDVYGGGYGSEDMTHTVLTVQELKTAEADPTKPESYEAHTYGFTPMQFAGCVGKNTYVNVAGGYIRKSIYGGGEMASVGIINYRAEKVTSTTSTDNRVVFKDEKNDDYYYTNMVKHADATKEFAFSWPYEFEYVDGYPGATHVKVTGGRIGLKSNDSDASYTDNGDVYGAGKGKAGDYKDYLFCANVGSTDVYIKFDATAAVGSDDDCISGAVYGGGEDGHVMGDTKLTLENGLIAHSLYGAGSGKGKFDATVKRIDNPTSSITRKIYSITAGKVFGNSTVEMNGGHVVRNIYGGGNMGSVGKGNYSGGTDDYSTSGYGETLNGPLWTASSGFNPNVQISETNKPITMADHFLGSGKCKVTITGGTVGYINPTNPSKSMYPLDSNQLPYDASLPYGNVFGGCRGEAAPNITESPRYLYSPETFVGYANETSVTIEGDAKILGSVYGGGMDGHVRRDASVIIKGGEIGLSYTTDNINNKVKTSDPNDIQWLARGNVYGSGSGIGKYKYDFNYDNDYNDEVTYNGKQTKEEDYSTSAGSVTRFTSVDIQGGTIYRNVYGGGSLSSIGAPKIPADRTDYPTKAQTLNEVIISGGQIGDANSYDASGNHVYGGDVFGGSRGDAQLNTSLFSTSMFTSISINKTNTTSPIIAGSVYGGGEVGIVKGSVDVTMNGGTVNHDVYGGGALANTNTANVTSGYGTDSEVIGSTSTYKTVVDLFGGMIKGDAYGGGLGRLHKDAVAAQGSPGDTDYVPAQAEVPAVEAKVYGDVTVKLGDDNRNGATAFNVEKYTEGTHAGIVKSGRVFGCNNLNGSPQGGVTVKVNMTKEGNTPRTAIETVGGKTVDKRKSETASDHSYHVAAVYGGGNLAGKTVGDKTNVIINGCDVSIRQVYGGGNAAAVPGTDVLVNGAWEIEQVFGGGNGKDDYTLDDGAHWTENPGANVNGNTNTLLCGGLIHEAYGGSNEKGTITGSVSINTSDDRPSDCDCELDVEKIVGAGKNADVDGDLIMVLGCKPTTKTPLVFGGADNANVNGNVELTITSGTFGKVFGGNNLGGIIKGHILLNIEETGCNPIKIDELYLGGNQAAYSVYGYYDSGTTNPTTGKKIYLPRTSASDSHTADPSHADDATHSFPYADPVLNVVSCTSIGKVFGGGLGEGAVMYADPTVNINMIPGAFASDDIKGVPFVMTEKGLSADDNPKNLGIIGNVYGGGNAADVIGNPTVNIGTAATVRLHLSYSTTGGYVMGDPIAVDGAYINGNVFGGGMGQADDFTCEKAMVGEVDKGIDEANNPLPGGTSVVIAKGTVNGSVYGGGEVGRVERNTKVTIGVEGGETQAIIKGSVFGAGAGVETHGYSALVRGNAEVTIQGKAEVWQNVHGGGEKASVGRYNVRLPGDTQHPEVRVGMPYSLKAGGKCTVNILDGATIGTEGDDETGHVYGAGQGITPIWKYDNPPSTDYDIRMDYSKRMVNYVAYDPTTETGHNPVDETKTWDYYPYPEDTNDPEYHKYVWEYFTTQDAYLQYVETLARASETDVVIGGKRVTTETTSSITTSSEAPTVKGSVYGGSESGFVYYSTEVNIPNGTVKGDVFGGGKGLDTFAEAGRVRRNTNLTISGGTVEGNVYGGGSFGDVGTIEKNADYNYKWKKIDVTTYNTAENNKITGENNNTGICTVTITGGSTIGIDSPAKPEEHGNVFGASRGINDTWWCEKAMVFATNVNISAGTVKGNVYGGGEVGRVEDDAKVTIGEANQTGETNAPIIMGSVFGAGAGVETHGYSALVRGNADVTIQGVAKVGGNVYGGGEIASVGRFHVVDGLPTKPESGGYCNVTIQDNAVIGTESDDETGYVFGACKGVESKYDLSNYKNFKSMQTVANGAKGTQGTDWDYYADDNRFVWKYYKTEEDYLAFLKTLALTSHPHVIITEDAKVYGSVYGGGQRGVTLGHVDVDIVGGTIGQDVYGGGALADTNLGNWDENTYVEATALNEGELITDLYTRSGSGTTESPYVYTKVTDSAADISSGTYYRQGTWSDAAMSAHYVTKVNILGGTISGDAYGGGLGQLESGTKGTDEYLAPIEAKVYGDVVVNLNGFDQTEVTYVPAIHGATTGEDARLELVGSEYLIKDDVKGAVVRRIFGCNNLNGSPQGTVKVHVFKTQRAGQTRITNTDAVTTAKVHVTPVDGEYDVTAYDVQAVYGGGNMAAYVPKDLTDAKTLVIIDGCDRTSIGQVYGGGNAASTPATDVTVNGTFEIAEVFGGGNGKDKITINNVLKDNPGANVGFYDYSAEENIYNTKEKRTTDPDYAPTFISKYVYGSGKAAVNIFGGTIHRVFGGSNTKGNVRQSAITLLEEVNDETGKPCCEFHVDEAYGGGKSAPMDAEAKLLMSCIPGLKEAYGGAEAADVYDDVSVTITNGNFDRVFGGNNLSGTIRGKITVNVEETGCKPIIIGELYGGGNQAGYSTYGYRKNAAGKTELVKPDDADAPSKALYDDPVVNVRSFTSIGNVFGGGYGDPAVMVGNPTVNINEVMGEKTNYTDDSTYKVGNTNVPYYDEEGFKELTKTIDGHDVVLPQHKKGKIGAINYVYGGGNAADVIGNTHVNIGTKSEEYLMIKDADITVGTTDVSSYYILNDGNYEKASGTAVAGTTYYKQVAVVGVDIRGNVYGGGNNAEVTGDTNVTIGQEKKTE